MQAYQVPNADFAEEHVVRDYRKDLAGQAGNTLQRLQSKVLLGKMLIARQAGQAAQNDQMATAIRERISTLPRQ